MQLLCMIKKVSCFHRGNVKLANLKPAWSKIFPSVLPQNPIQLMFVREMAMLALIVTSPVACGLSYTMTMYNVRSYQFSTFLRDKKSEILIHLPQPKIQSFASISSKALKNNTSGGRKKQQQRM